jgi:LEA14-like dessication related protein
MPGWFNLAILLTVALLMCSCSVFKAPKFERLNQVELKDITVDHTSLDLSLVISNPNWYAITVRSLKVEVTDTNSVSLGNIVMTQPLKLEKHKADTVYFDILLDTRKVTKLVSHSAQNVRFIVKANAVAKVFGVSKRVKLEQPQGVNFTKILEELLPNIPSEIQIPTLVADKRRRIQITDPSKKSSPIKADIFKVMKTSITDVGFKESELTVKFELLNPYGISFTFRDFPSEVYINDKYAGKGKLAQPLFFDENVFKREGELVFELNNWNSILLASRVLFKKDMDYRVNGTLLAEGFGTSIRKPFIFRGTVEIGKKDKE